MAPEDGSFFSLSAVARVVGVGSDGGSGIWNETGVTRTGGDSVNTLGGAKCDWEGTMNGGGGAGDRG